MYCITETLITRSWQVIYCDDCNATITVFPWVCHSVSTTVLNSACCVWMDGGVLDGADQSRGAEEKAQIPK